jgi:hypothetical protein
VSINVKVNGSLKGRAEDAAKKATEAAMRELFAAFQQSFTAKAWAWPGTTQRTVGTAGSPRNIIDIGNLRQSGTYQMTGPYSARFVWSANYATAVHEGYRRRRADGSASQWPARPWTSAVLGTVQVPGIKPFPLEQRLRDVWLARFKASR